MKMRQKLGLQSYSQEAEFEGPQWHLEFGCRMRIGFFPFYGTQKWGGQGQGWGNLDGKCLPKSCDHRYRVVSKTC